MAFKIRQNAFPAAWEAHDALPDSLVGWEGTPVPISHPTRRLQ